MVTDYMRDLDIGASMESVLRAEFDLGVRLPFGLRAILLICNGFTFEDTWRIYPVLEPRIARRCWGHIVEENQSGLSIDQVGRPIKIATDPYGNYLVVLADGDICGETILMWEHETARVSQSDTSFTDLLVASILHVERIVKRREGASARGRS